MYLDNKASEDLYTKKSAEIESNLDDLILSRSALTKTGFELLKYSENLFELFKMTAAIYFRLSNSKKRELLKMLCSNFLYDGSNVIITIKKAFQPLVKIAELENLGVERQCLNFLICIKTLVNTMQTPENLLILEQITILKNKVLVA